MYLFLNTSSADHVDFLFVTEKKILSKRHLPQQRGKRVDVLCELAKVLKKMKKTPKHIQGIGVVVGPGYFSHLRTGIAIANSFLFANGTPIVGVATDDFPKSLQEAKDAIDMLKKEKSTSFLEPAYGKDPTITVKKKKA